jgi:cytochrome d ubiquinol oxidase subunit II
MPPALPAPPSLAIVWFVLVAVLWTGFFILEGFDFGVGMLHTLVGRDGPERGTTLETIGPVWDGNEVWLVVAGAGMFAAFPGWYATTFSAFYLPLVLVLAGLIVRGVALEWRGHRDGARWRRVWSGLLVAGSLLVPLLLGVALGDLLHGIPIGADQEYAGTVLDLLTPYGLFAGLTMVLLCLGQGALFLGLRTRGEPLRRARRIARLVAPVTTAAVLAFVIWTHVLAGEGLLLNGVELIAVLAAFATVWLTSLGRDGWGFAASTVTVGGVLLSLFVDLYPRLAVSSLGTAFDLTVANSASGSYALTVMTVVAAVLLPVVLGYQAWSYHVFRGRIGAGPDTPGGPGTGSGLLARGVLGPPASGSPGHPSPAPPSPAPPAAVLTTRPAARSARPDPPAALGADVVRLAVLLVVLTATVLRRRGRTAPP